MAMHRDIDAGTLPAAELQTIFEGGFDWAAWERSRARRRPA